ncbi:hypothetical protein, partial [Falsiroseomonas sp. CW058]|uniref:hypothetical protein n=1 Tax=Falsiroseomonas sp. CW058 TaxID=3388664 RepID=UPI003D3114D0
MRRAGALALLLSGLPAVGWAEARVGLRSGDHAGHGRIVFDTPGRLDYRVEEQPGRILLRFVQPAAVDPGTLRRAPRNAAAVEAVEGGVAIAVGPGVRARHFRLDGRVVLD